MIPNNAWLQNPGHGAKGWIIEWKWTNVIWNMGTKTQLVDVGLQSVRSPGLEACGQELWGSQNCLCSAECTKAVYREHEEWKCLEETSRASRWGLAGWEQDRSFFRLFKIQCFSLYFLFMTFLYILSNTLYWSTRVRIPIPYNQECW